MSIESMAAALAAAAERHGARLTVATTIAQVSAAPGGIPLVTLSAGSGGTIDVVRTAMDHEGGALHHDRIMDWKGDMPASVSRWIEAWSLQVAMAERFGMGLAAAGAAPDDLPPWGVRVDAAAHCVIAAGGLDVGHVLASAEWRRSDSGFTMRRSEGDTTIDADRYLDQVRFTLLRLDAGGRTIQYEESGGEARIHIEARDGIPDTLLDGARGRPLSCLFTAERAEPPPNTIASAVQVGAELSITADIHHRRIAIPEPEKAA